jgi:predicted RNA binding protein YcfA (HicA-like mRNA interferase family)
MSRIPGIAHLRAMKALEKLGFRVARQGKHIGMTDGQKVVTIPRHDPVDAFTTGGIVRDAGKNPIAACRRKRKSPSATPEHLGGR